jgi:hypothetical protein
MTTPAEIARALHQSLDEHNAAWEASRTFDGRVAHLERLCRARRDAPESRRILIAIAEVRDALACGDWQRAASDAVVVGALAGHADARVWPAVRGWLQFLTKQRARSVAGVATKRDERAREDEVFLADVAAARSKHPGHSVRAIAGVLLRKHGRSGDRDKALGALAKRIARLLHRK